MIIYVPARLGSTRFPNKVLANIGGKPMIQVVCENAVKSKYVDRVVVLTEDEQIVDVINNINNYRIRCVNGTHGINGTNRVFNHITGLRESEQFTVLQADTPDLTTAHLDLYFDAVINSKHCAVHTIACAMTPLEAQKHQNVKVVVNTMGVAQYFSRSVIPYGSKLFLKHVGIYTFLRPVLEKHYKDFLQSKYHIARSEDLEQLDWMMKGIQTRVFVLDDYIRSVDTPGDLSHFNR